VKNLILGGVIGGLLIGQMQGKITISLTFTRIVE